MWRKRVEFFIEYHERFQRNDSGHDHGYIEFLLGIDQSTRGPYFVDNAADPNIVGDVVDSSIPERSDIRSDSKSGSGTQSGLPLNLAITVGSYSSSGTSANISGAHVHIWHCNAQGDYSDVQNLTSENFLRGYQYTDSKGQVVFTTIYPGWYSAAPCTFISRCASSILPAT
jgi:protocatechuate 3,4-dioxygenase beta subunit